MCRGAVIPGEPEVSGGCLLFSHFPPPALISYRPGKQECRRYLTPPESEGGSGCSSDPYEGTRFNFLSKSWLLLQPA